MNNLLLSATIATAAGGGMLLWKLLTGEHADPSTDAGKEQQASSDQAGLASPGSDAVCSQYSALSTPKENAEASAVWADASSECAEDEAPPSPMRMQSLAVQLQQRQLDEQLQQQTSQPESWELHPSESFISAASAEDEADVSSVLAPHLLGRTECTQPNSARTALPPACGAGTAAAKAQAAVSAGTIDAHQLQQQTAGAVAATAVGNMDGEQHRCEAISTASPSTKSEAAVAPVDGSSLAGRQPQQQAAEQSSAVGQVGIGRQKPSGENILCPEHAEQDFAALEAAVAVHANAAAGNDSASPSKVEAASPCAEVEAEDSDAAGEGGSNMHSRHSSSEQVEFEPIEPRVCLGGLGGGGIFATWQDNSNSVAAEWPSTTPSGVASAEYSQQVEEQQQEQMVGQQDQQLEQQSIEEWQKNMQLLQQRNLQPLNAADADAALDERHAMTDSLWASLRTVEVDREQLLAGSTVADGRPPLPPGNVAVSAEGPGSFTAAAGLSLQPSAFALQGVSLADSLNLCAVNDRTAAATAPSSSRQDAPARTGSGVSGSSSLFGPLSDWPSIQMGASLPSSNSCPASGAAKASQLQAASPGPAVAATAAPAAFLPGADDQNAGVVPSKDGEAAVSGQAIDRLVTDLQIKAGEGQNISAAGKAIIVEEAKSPAVEASDNVGGELIQQAPASELQGQQPLLLQQSEGHHQQQTHEATLQGHIDARHTAEQQQQPQSSIMCDPEQQEQQQGTDKQQQQQDSEVQSQVTSRNSNSNSQLLQSGSSRADAAAPAAALATIGSFTTNSGSLRSKKQQQHWKQLLQQQQQEQQPTTVADAANPAAGSLKSMLLQTVEAGGLAAAPQYADSAAAASFTAATTEGRLGPSGVSSSSSADMLLDPAFADMAAGLTAPRSWRPSRAALAAAGHSKLSVMTTAADAEPLLLRGSGDYGGHERSSTAAGRAADPVPGSAAGTPAEAGDDASDAVAPWLRLVVSAGPAAGKRFETSNQAQEHAIGRNPASWASIPDQEISGKHACLSWSPSLNCWQLADAGSLNGTSLNGTIISKPGRQVGCPAALRNGDRLELGSITRAVVECSPTHQPQHHLHNQLPQQQQQQQHLKQQRQLPGLLVAGTAAGRVSPSSEQQQQAVFDPCGATLEAYSIADAEPGQQHVQQLGHVEVPPWVLAAQQQQQQAYMPQPQQPEQQQQQLHLQQQPFVQQQQQQQQMPSCSPRSSTSSHSLLRNSWLETQATTAAPGHSNSSGSEGASSSPRSSNRISGLMTWGGTGSSCAGAISSSSSGQYASPRSSSQHALLLTSPGGTSSPGAPQPPPAVTLQFLAGRVLGAVIKMVGADHRRNNMPCEDVVAWRTPLIDRSQLGLFCVFDGHHSNNASQQAQQLLPSILAQHIPQQQQQPVLADAAGIAAALKASFLETDQRLTCDDGCTATALLLEGCRDRSVLLRVANVGDSMALLVELSSSGWRSLTEDHRIAGNPTEAARLSAKNLSLTGGVGNRLYGLNIARMLGDRFLKEADVGFSAEPFVSESIALGMQDEALLILASDGLWDVVPQERAAAMAAKTAAAAAAARRRGSDSCIERQGSSDGAAAAAGVSAAVSSEQHASSNTSSSNVAASVAEALMRAALSLRSKDDISIMVLHVLPAAAAGDEHGSALNDLSVSGCHPSQVVKPDS